jgi:trans-2,3-dihydro-3-hydroxyanthranilate isomerase
MYTAMESGMAPTTSPTHFAYRQVDVFSRVPFSGNGLTVFLEAEGLLTGAMQRITQEMRQFESIFLRGTRGAAVTEARLFTMEEELDFAGHPVLGAACVLHERQPELGRDASWRIQLHAGVVPVTTTRHETWYDATMDQGKPIFGAVAPPELQQALLNALNLEPKQLDSSVPMQMVSTGLPYLLVPLASGLERAAITHPQFEALLAQIGAKFVYVFDVARLEGRTWDNGGRVEDVATGSAAGPLGAYLVRYGRARPGKAITLRQGCFVGRPSEMTVRVTGKADAQDAVLVSGAVAFVGQGTLDATPLLTAQADAPGTH